MSCCGDLPSERPTDTPFDVDLSEFLKFKLRIFSQLTTFKRKVGPLGVGLGADGYIFAGGHRHCASH